MEVEEFEASEAFSKMMERVNSRVGLHLDKEEAGLMWNICRSFVVFWNLCRCFEEFDGTHFNGPDLRLPGTWERTALGVPGLCPKT